MGDGPLWAIVGAFLAWEAYAHFVARNRASHTLSNRIWAVEERHPWIRAVVWVAMQLLSLHLALAWPV